MATKTRTKKRRKPPQRQQNMLFSVPTTPYSRSMREVAEQGEMRFFPFKYPFLDSEKRRPRVWIVYMTLGEKQLLLGYVWKQTGADWWRARQPGGPWRGKFASMQAGSKALLAPYVPTPQPKLPRIKPGQRKPMRNKRKATNLTWKD